MRGLRRGTRLTVNARSCRVATFSATVAFTRRAQCRPKLLKKLAGTTGLEPATSCVTDKPSTFSKLLPFNHFIQNKRLKLCGRMCVAVSNSRQVPIRSLHFPLQYLPLPPGLTGGMEVGNHRRNQGGC